MKTLLLIRHAKSEPGAPSIHDFDRTLTDKGKEDAVRMAKKIKEHPIVIDLFVSSSAKRAVETAEIFMQELGSSASLQLINNLYEASVYDFYDAVESFDDSKNTVAIFAHNPGITEFANSLKCSPVYNMPTCSVYAVKIETDHWKDFHESPKKFLM